MEVTTTFLVQVAAAVTATAATGTFLAAVAIWRDVERIKRIVFGNEDVDAWNGLIEEVRKNREALLEEGIR